MNDLSPLNDFPPLREELQLLPGEPDAKGEPGWFIFDPVRNQYFRIGQESLMLLHYWRQGAVAERLKEKEGEEFDNQAVDNLKKFLQENQLLKVTSGDEVSHLILKQKQEQENRTYQIIFSYLFFRIPLIKPDHLLEKMMNVFKPMISVKWLYIIGMMGLTGFYLSFRQWDYFVNSPAQLLSPTAVFYFFIALIFTKTVHEFGHGLAAKYYGCRVPAMGVALIVFFPVLYTDTTDAWRLGSYQKRMVIGVAGVCAELIIACLAMFIWPFLPEGGVKHAVFMLAAVTWVSSLLINLNPLIRFDGYYLLSDWWRIENLQNRAFTLARWQLREWLFHLSHPMPESWNRKQRKKLLLFAYGTWVYRLVLFTGIALLIYQLLFKLAGLLLLAATIFWLIFRPVAKEIRYIWSIKHSIRVGRNLVIKVGAFLFLCSLLFLPIKTTVSLPAVIMASDAMQVFPPQAGGVIDDVFVTEGEFVTKGQLLLRLKNTNLKYQARQREIQLGLVQTLLDRMAANIEYTQSAPVLLQRKISLNQALAGLRQQTVLLDVKAPVDGVIVFLDDLLTHGQWVNPDTPLLQLRSESGLKIDGYISPKELERVARGDSGRFYPEDITASPTDVHITDISPVASEIMDNEYLSADYGGPIDVIRDEQGRAVPLEGAYRVRFSAEEQNVMVDQVSVGTVRLEVEGRNIAGYLWDHFWGVVVRESGF